MKIVQLRFKNLNSLMGEWLIDFTHQDYKESDLFAITGPTGAGQSTLLDALCLALYGRTPRLGRITQSTNEIMSRQSAECFAEVCFETASGRYRSYWGQHKARQKIEGALQPPKHELSDEINGKVLATQSSLVPKHIEDLTGMDFDRFTRSMLLAQGDFAAFLHADANSRAPILEQMTGTQVYSDLSIHVHEHHKQLQAQLQQLREQSAQLEILDAEAEEALTQELTQQLNQQQLLTNEGTTLEAAKQWLIQQQQLQQELNYLKHQYTQWQQQWTQFSSQHHRLKKALDALSLEGAHATLQAAQQRLVDEQQQALQLEKQISQLNAQRPDLMQQLEIAEQNWQRAQQRVQQVQPLLRGLQKAYL